MTQLGTHRFSQSRPYPSAVDAVQFVQVRSCTPTPASPHARMTDGGSLLGKYGAGPAQLATTPTPACAVAVGAVVVAVVAAAIVVCGAAAGDRPVVAACPADAAVAVVVALDPAAELAWCAWHPATATPSAAQRATFRSVGLMSLKTRFARDGCMARQVTGPFVILVTPAAARAR